LLVNRLGNIVDELNAPKIRMKHMCVTF